MEKVLRRQRAGYVLSVLLCLTGLTAVLGALWKAWSASSSTQNLTSAIWAALWTAQLDLIPGVEFKLIYLVVLGATMLVLGVIVLALSRQWILPAGDRTLFRCPFCRKRWRASPDKALVHCPHCRQLVHPTPVEK